MLLSLAESLAAASEIAVVGARFSLELLAEVGSREVLRLPDDAEVLGPVGLEAGMAESGAMLASTFKVGVTGLATVGVAVVVGFAMAVPGVGMPVDLRAGSLLAPGIPLGFFMPEAPGLGLSGSIY